MRGEQVWQDDSSEVQTQNINNGAGSILKDMILQDYKGSEMLYQCLAWITAWQNEGTGTRGLPSS